MAAIGSTKKNTDVNEMKNTCAIERTAGKTGSENG